MAERILLFGGTFDPVHNGHLIVARAVAEARGFRRVVLVPAARPPHKAPARATADQRLDMLRLAIEGEPLFEVCGRELSRRGPSFTIDTLHAIAESEGERATLHLLIGADMLEEFPQWHRADEIIEVAQVVIALRPPWDLRIEAILAAMQDHFGPDKAVGLRNNVVATPRVEISSTLIRARAAAGKSIRYLVPDSVSGYIARNGLYRSDSQSG